MKNQETTMSKSDLQLLKSMLSKRGYINSKIDLQDLSDDKLDKLEIKLKQDVSTVKEVSKQYEIAYVSKINSVLTIEELKEYDLEYKQLVKKEGIKTRFRDRKRSGIGKLREYYKNELNDISLLYSLFIKYNNT